MLDVSLFLFEFSLEKTFSSSIPADISKLLFLPIWHTVINCLENYKNAIDTVKELNNNLKNLF